jgi:hypothetical protein
MPSDAMTYVPSIMKTSSDSHIILRLDNLRSCCVVITNGKDIMMYSMFRLPQHDTYIPNFMATGSGIQVIVTV